MSLELSNNRNLWQWWRGHHLLGQSFSMHCSSLTAPQLSVICSQPEAGAVGKRGVFWPCLNPDSNPPAEEQWGVLRKPLPRPRLPRGCLPGGMCSARSIAAPQQMRLPGRVDDRSSTHVCYTSLCAFSVGSYCTNQLLMRLIIQGTIKRTLH